MGPLGYRVKDRKPQAQEELYGTSQGPAPPRSEELGAAGVAVQAGTGWVRGSSQVLLFPRQASDRPAHGNAVCRSSRSWGERTAIKLCQRGLPTPCPHIERA